MSIAPTVPRPPWAVSFAYARGTVGAIFLLFTRPHSPAHLNAHAATLTELARQSYSRSTYRTRTMSHTPLIPPSLRSVAHEPTEEPNRLQGGGSCRRERDSSHAHTGSVPGHHRHFAARHSRRLMLHCSARCWIRGVCGIVPPCMHGQAVKVLAWMSSPTRRCDAYGLAAIGVFCYRRLHAYALDGHPTFQPEEVPPLPTEGCKSGTPHLPTTENGLSCGNNS